MHVNGAVEGNPSVQEGVPQSGDGVSAHRHQQGGVRPHDAARRSARHGDAVPRDATQPPVLPLHRVICVGKAVVVEFARVQEASQ